MCGIIGVYIENVTPEQIEAVEKLIQESTVRGVHAMGVAFRRNGNIGILKAHVSTLESLLKDKLEAYIDDGTFCMIGHTRYSTSDWEYNQPIGDRNLAICHNGVISQEPHDSWEDIFGLQTKTSNDSELIFGCLDAGDEPLEKFKGSMAVCTIDKDGVIAFRNHERPLWYAELYNGVVFASTEDILLRSGFENPVKCRMFERYAYIKGKVQSSLVRHNSEIEDLQ